MPSQNSIREEYLRKIANGDFDAPAGHISDGKVLDFFLSRMVSKSELMEWIEESPSWTKKDYSAFENMEDTFSDGYNQALSDIKAFLNREII